MAALSLLAALLGGLALPGHLLPGAAAASPTTTTAAQSAARGSAWAQAVGGGTLVTAPTAQGSGSSGLATLPAPLPGAQAGRTWSLRAAGVEDLRAAATSHAVGRSPPVAA